MDQKFKELAEKVAASREKDLSHNSKAQLKDDIRVAIIYAFRYAMDHNDRCAPEVIAIIKRHFDDFSELAMNSMILECKNRGGVWFELIDIYNRKKK